MESTYCLSCKEKTNMLNPVESVTKNGRNAIKGTCSKCSKNVSKMVKGKGPAPIKYPVKIVDDSNLSKKETKQKGGLILASGVILPLALKMSLPLLQTALAPLLKMAGVALATYLIRRFELFGLLGDGMNIMGTLAMLAVETNPYRIVMLKLELAIKAHELLESIKDKFTSNRKKAVTTKLRTSKREIQAIVERFPELEGLSEGELETLADIDKKKLDTLIKSLDKLYSEGVGESTESSEEQAGGEIEEVQDLKKTRGKLIIGSTPKVSS